MSDQIKSVSAAPAQREPNKLASTNITNELATALGGFTVRDGIGRGPRFGHPIALITSTAGVAIGYYKIDVYQRDALLMDPTVRMSSTKLGSANRSKLGPAYGYSWDELTATEHLLSAGQVFRCEQVGTHTDGLGVYELIGNPIGVECDE